MDSVERAAEAVEAMRRECGRTLEESVRALDHAYVLVKELRIENERLREQLKEAV